LPNEGIAWGRLTLPLDDTPEMVEVSPVHSSIAEVEKGHFGVHPECSNSPEATRHSSPSVSRFLLFLRQGIDQQGAIGCLD
jgi:hypothetical protein